MTDPVKIRVCLADDHPFIRAGIKSVLSSEPDILVVGEANNGDEVFQFCVENEFDILVLDLKMPGPSCKEIVAKVKDLYPHVIILILSAYQDEVYIRALSSLGVKGYVLKDDVIGSLAEAIRSIYSGGLWFSQKIVKKIIDISLIPKQNALTDRELEILILLREGHSYKEIGESLNLSQRTIRFHLTNIFQKLDAKSSLDAVAKAVENGLLS